MRRTLDRPNSSSVSEAAKAEKSCSPSITCASSIMRGSFSG